MKTKRNTFLSPVTRFSEKTIRSLLCLVLFGAMLPIGIGQAFAGQEAPPVQGIGNADGDVGDDPSDATDPAGDPATDPASDPAGEPATDPTDNNQQQSPGLGAVQPSMPMAAAAPLATNLPDLCTISSTINTGKVIDVPGATTANAIQLQLWDDNITPAQRFRCYLNDDGSYTIQNIKSGLNLDLQSALAFNGAVVWQYTPNGTDAQKWFITDMGDGYKIASKVNPDYCLDVPGAHADNAAKMQVYIDNGTKAQRFYINGLSPVLPDGAYTIHTTTTVMALDITWASSASGTKAQVYTPNGTLAQRFNLKYDTKTGYYNIINIQSAKALDISNFTTALGTQVQIWDVNGSFAQLFAIIPTSDGLSEIVVSYSSHVLQTPTTVIGDCTPVQTGIWSNSYAQKWRFVPSVPCDQYIYQLHSGVGTMMDVFGNYTAAGSRVCAYQGNGTNAQKFFLRHYQNGYYKLDHLGSGLLITASGTNIIIDFDSNKDSQLWLMSPAGEGAFFLINKANGMALDVKNANPASNTDLQLYTLNYTNAQRWKPELVDPLCEGLYTVFSAQNGSLVLDIKDNSTADGARLQVYQSNETTAQKFEVVPLGNSYYRIYCLNSHKAVEVRNSTLSPQGIVQLAPAYGGFENSKQIWKVTYLGSGGFRIYSALGNGNNCMTIDGNAVSSTYVNVYPYNGSASQTFVFRPAGTTTYVNLRISINQMVEYQRKGNPYIGSISDEQLRDVIDPAKAMANYWFPGHTSQYTYGNMQFVDLRHTTGLSADQINTIINAYAPQNSSIRGRGAAFVQAAQTYNLNESYLLAHCALESGWGTSALSNGSINYDGTPIDGIVYPKGVYYNFFGIGAIDSSPYSGGASYAIRNGWDSIDKAITGGAKWIAEGYIYRDVYNAQYSQPTLYAMKWDYLRSNNDLAYGWHQYATDHLWARKIARLMGDFYNQVGYTPTLTYIIPQYTG